MAPEASNAQRDRWSGRTIGEFRIKHPLGAGGFGTVYLAEQPAVARDVVVKVIRRALTDEPKVAERFRREARLAARINHPNIVQVITAGSTEEDELYLVMEYVPGPTLGDVIGAEGRLSDLRALHIGEQVSAALAAAHGAGIVHRDLKPANVILAEMSGRADHVKVLDFGIAKLLDGEADGGSALTASGAIIGTPAYMSPEQVSGREVDGRSDIYTLGVMLYEMVTGLHPYAVSTPVEYIISHLQEPITPPSERVPGIDVAPELEQIIARCTAKAPEDRFEDAESLRLAIRAAIDDVSTDPTTIARFVPPRPVSSSSSGLPLAALLLVVLGLAFTVAGGVLYLLLHPSQPSSELMLSTGTTGGRSGARLHPSQPSSELMLSEEAASSAPEGATVDAGASLSSADVYGAARGHMRAESSGDPPKPALVPRADSGTNVAPAAPPMTAIDGPIVPRRTRHGVDIPASARTRMNTPTLEVYMVPRSFEALEAFYRERYDGGRNLMINVGQRQGARYMTIVFTAGTNQLSMLGIVEERPELCRVNLFPRAEN